MMSEKEPRKRRRKKEGSKKDEHGEEVFSLPKSKQQKEELSDSDGDGDVIAAQEANGVARCVFLFLFAVLIAASGIVYYSLQGTEKNVPPDADVQEEISPEQMHPWAQHEEKENREINFDSLYEESDFEDEAEFLDSSAKSFSGESFFEEFTQNVEPEAVSISDIADNPVVHEEPFHEFTNSELQEEMENQIPIAATFEERVLTLDSGGPSSPEQLTGKIIEESSSTEYLEQPGPSYSQAGQISLEPSIASLPSVESSALPTHSSEGEPQAQSTDHVASSESVEKPSEIVTDGTSEPPATVDVTDWQDASTTVHNTAAPSSEITREEVQPEPSSDLPYENEDITNDYDFIFRDELDEADEIVQKSPEKALKIFDSLLTRHPKSPRAKYGQARCLDRLADVRRNNALLEQAVEAYLAAMKQPKIKDALYVKAGDRAANRMRFRGFVNRALNLQKEMSEKYPGNADLSNQVAVTYLMAGKAQAAKKILKQVLEKHPSNGFAQVHYGFILKTEDNNYEDAIRYLSEGIASKEPGVIDGRFFFQLGDALSRTNQSEKATKVYEQGVEEGVFLSVYQRSLYNVDGLTGKPWWKPEETRYHAYIEMLEKNWEVIRNEALALMDDKYTGFTPESEGLQDKGDWKQFEMFARGRRLDKSCQRAPRTCSLLDKIPDASGCKRGQIKFSIMEPGTHIWAHTGPTNCRLRSHLGLVVPKGPRIRVANETREWTEGKVLMFDDSFEHEVWHDGKSFRLVLIVDFWHPELTPEQKKSLTPI